MNKVRASKETEIIKMNQIEILELNSTIIETNHSQEDSAANLNRWKKESVNLKMGQLQL